MAKEAAIEVDGKICDLNSKIEINTNIKIIDTNPAATL